MVGACLSTAPGLALFRKIPTGLETSARGSVAGIFDILNRGLVAPNGLRVCTNEANGQPWDLALFRKSHSAREDFARTSQWTSPGQFVLFRNFARTNPRSFVKHALSKLQENRTYTWVVKETSVIHGHGRQRGIAATAESTPW